MLKHLRGDLLPEGDRAPPRVRLRRLRPVTYPRLLDAAESADPFTKMISSSVTLSIISARSGERSTIERAALTKRRACR